MTDTIDFNINNYAFIKLTPKGILHWQKDFEKYAPKDYLFAEHYSKHTNDGWTKLQLHEVMDIFGGEAILDNLFETTIKLQCPTVL